MIKNKCILVLVLVISVICSGLSQEDKKDIQRNIPLDSIRLSDPFILADKNTATYYMTGTG